MENRTVDIVKYVSKKTEKPIHFVGPMELMWTDNFAHIAGSAMYHNNSEHWQGEGISSESFRDTVKFVSHVYFSELQLRNGDRMMVDNFEPNVEQFVEKHRYEGMMDISISFYCPEKQAIVSPSAADRVWATHLIATGDEGIVYAAQEYRVILTSLLDTKDDWKGGTGLADDEGPDDDQGEFGFGGSCWQE